MERISIGFSGGQSLSLRVDDSALKALNKALGGDGWHELSTDEGTVNVRVGEIVYVRTENAETKVGFGL